MSAARIAALALGLALAGCAAAPAAERPLNPGIAAPRPITGPVRPFAGVMGANAASLVAAFGQPSLDLVEGQGRKLQFAGPICVIDAYLYPRGGEAIVTHYDARQRNGQPIDPASCVAALRAQRPN